MQIKEIVAESDFFNVNTHDLELMVNFLHIRKQHLGTEGNYSFDVKDKVSRNKNLAYVGLIGQTTKSFKLTGGVIHLEGKFEKPVSFNKAFKELGEFHRLFGVDFVSSKNKLVKHTNHNFENYFKVNQVSLTDGLFQKEIPTEEDFRKKLDYKITIRCMGGFTGTEIRGLNTEEFNVVPSFLDDDYLNKVDPVLVGEEYFLDRGKQQWGNISYPYKYLDVVKRGKGVLKLSDACKWYNNFMLWYKQHNSALRFLFKSYHSAKKLKDHGDASKVEGLINASHAGYARSPLAPELRIEFQDYEVVPSLKEDKIIRAFDVSYSNKFKG